MERSAWTDDRLDDLATALREDIRGFRAEMRAGDADIREQIRHLRADFSSWQRQIAQIGWALVGTLVAAIVALVIASL